MGVLVKGDDKCVASATSVIRAFLGYKTPLPKCLSGDYSTQVEWIAKNAHNFFPKHRVRVMCDSKFSDAKGYSGSHFDREDFEKSITMFEYHKTGTEDGHMVVGDPCIYDGMETAICITVDCEVKRI